MLEDKVFREFEDANKKTKTILRDLDNLKNIKNPKIVDSVSTFLLDSQYAEWGAKQLVNKLDTLVSSHGIKRVNRYGYIKNQTLGRIIELIEQYSFNDKTSEHLQKNLVNKLKDLNYLRRKYVHHLFSSSTKGSDIRNESKKGVRLCEEIHMLIAALMLLQDKKMADSLNINSDLLDKLLKRLNEDDR